MEEKQKELIKRFLDAVAEGDYSYVPDKNEFDGDALEIFDGIKKIRKKMLQYVFEMQVASSQVLSATDQIGDTLAENETRTLDIFDMCQNLNALNTDSQQTVAKTVGEVRNIARLLQEVKHISGEAKETSEQSKITIDSSLEEILGVVKSISHIQKSTYHTVDYLYRLEMSTQEIANFLNSVELIARQTHLLSINASIESSRAGIYGRGFSVITDEIRRLAGDSRQAVIQISSLIDRISGEMTALAESLNEDIVEINKSVEFSKKVEGSLGRIEQSYSKVQNMLGSIIQASNEEDALALEISRKITAVENISCQVADGFKKIYDSVHDQKHSMEDLQAMAECLNTASQSLSILVEKADVDMLEVNSDKIEQKVQDVFAVLKNEVLQRADFEELDPGTHRKILDDTLSKYPLIEAIWSNTKKGKFIHSNPPAGIANAKVREWFKNAMQGEQFVSDIYISAITKNPCMTLSLPILSSQGDIIGVVGADLSLG